MILKSAGAPADLLFLSQSITPRPNPPVITAVVVSGTSITVTINGDTGCDNHVQLRYINNGLLAVEGSRAGDGNIILTSPNDKADYVLVPYSISADDLVSIPGRTWRVFGEQFPSGRRPLRMNLVDIVLELKDTDATIFDSNYREPIGPKRFQTPITLRGQVNYGSKTVRRRTPTMTGDAEEDKGHILFSMQYLMEEGIVQEVGGTIACQIKKGDLIKSIADVACDHEIVEVRPESPLRGSFLLLYVEFTNNTEKRTSV